MISLYRALPDSLAQMAQMEKMVCQERKGRLVERADPETLYVDNDEMHLESLAKLRRSSIVIIIG